MNYYSNLRLYDQKGRRVALFGREKDGGIEVFELTCSKKDAFVKKMAHRVYNQYLEQGLDKVIETGFHPELYMVKPEDNSCPKWSFLKYCNENYFSIKNWIYTFMGNPFKEVRVAKLGRRNNILTIQSLIK